MPKKFQGENTKAAEARARKAAQQKEENEKRQQEKEDELWKDDDKSLAKKAQRKEEKLKKQQEVLNRKQENRALFEKEMDQIGGKAGSSQKVTQADIQAHQDRMRQERMKEDEKARLEEKKIVVPDDLLTENVNRLEIEGEQARNVEEAIQILTDAVDSADRNPEKRLKSAFAAYEEKFLPILKSDNPTLRLSQVRQLLKKQWQKAPENPMNQARNEV